MAWNSDHCRYGVKQNLYQSVGFARYIRFNSKRPDATYWNRPFRQEAILKLWYVRLLTMKALTKTKVAFPNQNNLLKLLYMGIQNTSKKWTMPIQNWSLTISQLAIFFKGRLDIELRLWYDCWHRILNTPVLEGYKGCRTKSESRCWRTTTHILSFTRL